MFLLLVHFASHPHGKQDCLKFIEVVFSTCLWHLDGMASSVNWSALLLLSQHVICWELGTILCSQVIHIRSFIKV